MGFTQLEFDTDKIPKIFSHKAVENNHNRWNDLIDKSTQDELKHISTKIRNCSSSIILCNSLFGNSPYLSRLILTDISFFGKILQNDLNVTYHEVVKELKSFKLDGASLDDLKKTLRIAKRKIALLTAVADITQNWTVEKITKALSSFADIAIQKALQYFLLKAHYNKLIQVKDMTKPELNSGFFILAVGKLGAFELNYSSDIDLIFLFDPTVIETNKPSLLQKTAVQIIRDIVDCLQSKTGEGYVFRTDLRLRPDPGSTPIALSTIAAENYYYTVGQNWERAALIKARPCAGDFKSARSFLKIIRHFIWRKHLDFKTIRDIHAMKRQIYKHHGGEKIKIQGHNIKIGRGGIREIEFFTQTEQLIWGGRLPKLRDHRTCVALEKLKNSNYITEETYSLLTNSYYFLRTLEHRLQMINDEQTHTIPEKDDEFLQIAYFMGYKNAKSLQKEIVYHLQSVEKRYAGLFEKEHPLTLSGNLVFTGVEDDPGTTKTLENLGFNDPSKVQALVRGWHYARYRSTKSDIARQLLTDLIPHLIKELSETADPDAAIIQFDEFLKNLPTSIQFFSLLNSNKNILGLLAQIMGTAPKLGQHLSKHIESFDALLMKENELLLFQSINNLEDNLKEWLKLGDDYQEVLDLARSWANEKKFLVGLRYIQSLITSDEAGLYFTYIAESIVRQLTPYTIKEFEEKHGHVKGSSLTILAYGKSGSQEMTSTSDLDLTFIYDYPNNIEISDGIKPLPVSLYFSRLCNRITTSLSSPTGKGTLYDVDLRLRPSGNSGPIAVNFEAFKNYQLKEAWIWEHMALTRARVIFGEQKLIEKVTEVIFKALTLHRNPEKLKSHIKDMREKIDQHYKTDNSWRLKYVRGGLIDVEFITQYLLLKYGHQYPDCLHPKMGTALKKLKTKNIIDDTIMDTLIKSVQLWKALQSLIRITLAQDFDEQRAPKTLLNKLAEVSGYSSFDLLKEKVIFYQKQVVDIFDMLFNE